MVSNWIGSGRDRVGLVWARSGRVDPRVRIFDPAPTRTRTSRSVRSDDVFIIRTFSNNSVTSTKSATAADTRKRLSTTPPTYPRRVDNICAFCYDRKLARKSVVNLQTDWRRRRDATLYDDRSTIDSRSAVVSPDR